MFMCDIGNELVLLDGWRRWPIDMGYILVQARDCVLSEMVSCVSSVP